MNKRKQEGKPQTDSQAGNVGLHHSYNFQFDLIENIGHKRGTEYIHTHTYAHIHTYVHTYFELNEEVAFLGRIYFRVYMSGFQ